MGTDKNEKLDNIVDFRWDSITGINCRFFETINSNASSDEFAGTSPRLIAQQLFSRDA